LEIPPALVGECLDESFREGLLELAETALELPDDPARTRRARIRVYLAFNELDKARSEFAALRTPDNTQHYDHYQHALICLVMGEAAKYRESCETMLERFGNAEDPMAAGSTAWTCSLGPEAVESYERAIALANKALEKAPESDQYLNSLGAILYRAGRTHEAMDQLSELEQSLENPDTKIRYSPAYTWYFLAMAHQKAGNEEQAREYLKKANQWTDEVLANNVHPPAWTRKMTSELLWNRRVTLELLRKEAEALLGTDVEESAEGDQEPEPKSDSEPKS
jgi:tetratricopeptide (TPR) repeat protein